ncbi:MAG TPA: metal-dependent hydrolase [Nitratifractor salsuginis]|uniref:Metal-dependent hydrolase n=1 Tax=Nitratifractor salsuginis TaxID=269261 RepID=A0A7V2SM88_9BACT|nr:metal-dependent hydrolase [Nitratifractor salsuginis]
MTTIILPDYLYTPEGYLREKAVAFDDRILTIDTPERLREKYPEARLIDTGSDSILYPGFINVHTHLEYSANRTRLEYGDFLRWLESVIRERDTLVPQADNALMEAACRQMLRCGITGFGAVSTFGTDLEVCRRVPQRVTYFNEIIGSNPATVDMLYQDFLQRLDASRSCSPEERITPAVAIHAPHSTHPVMVRRAVALAREEQLPLSAHFLESPAERQWLEEAAGDFKSFFENYLKSDRPVTTIEAFLSQFDGYSSLFVHAVQTTEEERGHLAEQGHHVAHCPRSNRLLGCGRYPLEDRRVPVALATDGLSSNWSLSLFDEMRAALMLHYQAPLQELAELLLRAVTLEAARSLRSDAGRIEEGAPADFALIRLPQPCPREEDLALQTILHTRQAERVWIAGEELPLDHE